MGSNNESGPAAAIAMVVAGTGFSTPRNTTLGVAERHPPAGQVRQYRRRSQRLPRRGMVAQPRRDVHGVPDVVVASIRMTSPAVRPERIETVSTGPETTLTT